MRRHHMTGNIVLQNGDDFDLALGAVDTMFKKEPSTDLFTHYQLLLHAKELNATQLTQVHLDPKLTKLVEATMQRTVETISGPDDQLGPLIALDETEISGPES